MPPSREISAFAFTVQVAADDATFEALAGPWNALLDRCPSATAFHGFAFNRMVWRHARQPDDKLLVITLHEGERLRGVAPLRLTRRRYLGLPVRQLEWLAAWEGDRPALLTDGDPSQVWATLSEWLLAAAPRWDVLRLQECNTDWVVPAALAARCVVHRQRDGVGYHVALNQFADAAALRRHLGMATSSTTVEVVQAAADLPAALARFVALDEQVNGTGGQGHYAVRQAFYDDWLKAAAQRDGTQLCFLQEHGRDEAAALLWRDRSTVVERHLVAGSEAQATALRAAAMESAQQAGCSRYDMLGQDPARGERPLQAACATEVRETQTVLCLRRGGRMAWLWSAVRRLTGRSA